MEINLKIVYKENKLNYENLMCLQNLKLNRILEI